MTTISIKIKLGTDRIEVIEIEPNVTVKELKQKLIPKFNTEPSQMKIIFQRKILKDFDILQEVNVKADQTMHLIITNQQAQQPPQQQAPQSNYQQPQQSVGGQQGRIPGFGGFEATNGMQNLGQMGGLGGLGGIGGLSGMGMDPQMMMKDPYSILQLLQHPIYQSQFSQMLQNPLVRQQFMQNPMVAQIMQSYPQFQQILVNPQLLQMMMNSQAIQMALQRMDRIGGIQGIADFFADMGGFSEIEDQLIPPNPNTVQVSPSNPLESFDQHSLMNMMGGGIEGAGGAQLTTEAADQKYATQLQQLQELGFTNKQLNLEALIATRGNLEAAVDIILNMMKL